jgi:hypothetical protein
MTSKPLDTLKKGLATLQRHISAKRDALTTCFKNRQPISKADETWLDQGEGNMVDEERVLDLLERAPDYEQELQQLSLQDKLVVENLQKLAAELTNVTGGKRAAGMDSENKVSNKRARSSAC